jgi:hypothetical protein
MFTDLAEVSANLTDDLNIGNNDTYQDALPPAPPKEGNYRLRINKMSLAKGKDGQLTLQQGTHPVVVLEDVVIVEPVELEGKSAVRFERVYIKPYQRAGQNADNLTDIVRAHSIEATYSGWKEGLQVLQSLAEQGASFRAQIVWEAFDNEGYTAEVDALGGRDSVDKDTEKRLRKEYTIKGMKKFKQNPDGTFAPIVVHPVTGNTLEAKARISRFYPSNATVKLVQ